jgi:hypothetical protein
MSTPIPPLQTLAAIRAIAADRLFVSPIICDKFAAESKHLPACDGNVLIP